MQCSQVEAFLLLIGYQPKPYYLKWLVNKKADFVCFCTPHLHFHVIIMQVQNHVGNAFVFSNSFLVIMVSSVCFIINYLVH